MIIKHSVVPPTTEAAASSIEDIVPAHLKDRAEEANKIAQGFVLKEQGWTCYSQKKGIRAYRATTPDGCNVGKGVGKSGGH